MNQLVPSPYRCPICQDSLNLTKNKKSYLCATNHHFDLAKEGYLNLLPAQHKKSKQPGDSKTMMQARGEFLDAGFYQPLAKAITTLVDNNFPADSKKIHILDMGCGEGYYSRQISNLSTQASQLTLHGIDIAKNAIITASKKQKDAHYIVASNNNMPYTTDFFDLIFRVYAPSNDEEVTRLLKAQGLLLIVIPGPRHLWQLRELIYAEVKPHSADIKLPENFTVINTQQLSYRICPNANQRLALLQMTPFAWKVNFNIQEKIKAAEQLTIEVDFLLSLVQKN
jgi:23S rRNA (guanine745-N1)-methyltransferase